MISLVSSAAGAFLALGLAAFLVGDDVLDAGRGGAGAPLLALVLVPLMLSSLLGKPRLDALSI